MKIKLDDDGHAVLDNGKPVYVKDDGTEIAFDVVGTQATIGRLNGEARTNRERYETAEKALKTFEGIEDPAAAIKAIETVANLDAKKLVDAGEVEKVKQAAIEAVEAQYKPIVEDRDNLQSELYQERVGGSFARSKYIADDLAIPADMAQARFGKHFKSENGKIVAYDHAGNQIFDPGNPGEVAGFDTALKVLIDNYPDKDSIIKASGASGGGAQVNNGAGGNVGKINLTGTGAERRAAIENRFPDLPKS